MATKNYNTRNKTMENKPCIISISELTENSDFYTFFFKCLNHRICKYCWLNCEVIYYSYNILSGTKV